MSRSPMGLSFNKLLHRIFGKEKGYALIWSKGNKLEAHVKIPVMLSLLYFVAGALWILYSDRQLETLIIERNTLTWLQSAKGWLFVAATSILIYLLTRKHLTALDRARKEKDEMYRFIIEGTTEGQWDYDLVSGRLYVSPQWMKYMGYDENTAVSNTEDWKELIHPDDYPKIMKRVSDYIKGSRKRFFAEGRIRTGEGDYCWMQINGLAIRDDNGEVKRLIGTYTDITPRKNVENTLRNSIKENERLLEEVIKYDRLKSEFFSNISHEFRTPINIILGTLQLMDVDKNKTGQNTSKENTQDRYLESLRQNSFRLLHIVNNMMDITSIDTGMMKAQLSNTDIVGAVRRIIKAAAEYMKDTTISIELSVDVEWKLMACDLDKFDKILLNLVSNAVKHSKPGGSIQVMFSDRDEKVLLAVADNGSGISGDKLEIIFDRFRQGDSLLTRDSEGAGIGLSLTKSLVELLGGRIWVKSQLGKGSTFYVELPAQVLPTQDEWVGAGKIMLADPREKVRIEFSDIYLERYKEEKKLS